MIDAFKPVIDEIGRKSKYGVWESVDVPYPDRNKEPGKVIYYYCSNHLYKKIDQHIAYPLSNGTFFWELGSPLCENCETIDKEKYLVLSGLMNDYENADPEEEVNQGAFVLEWSKIQGDKE
jgi:hypothetical protein